MSEHERPQKTSMAYTKTDALERYRSVRNKLIREIAAEESARKVANVLKRSKKEVVVLNLNAKEPCEEVGKENASFLGIEDPSLSGLLTCTHEEPSSKDAEKAPAREETAKYSYGTGSDRIKSMIIDSEDESGGEGGDESEDEREDESEVFSEIEESEVSDVEVLDRKTGVEEADKKIQGIDKKIERSESAGERVEDKIEVVKTVRKQSFNPAGIGKVKNTTPYRWNNEEQHGR